MGQSFLIFLVHQSVFLYILLIFLAYNAHLSAESVGGCGRRVCRAAFSPIIISALLTVLATLNQELALFSCHKQFRKL